MKIILAPDSFKGSASAKRITEIFERAISEELPECTVRSLPMADGGEGTMEIVTKALSGEIVTANVKDPLYRDITASFGLLCDGRAVIEMAEASGLTLVPQDKRDPVKTTTYGTGELILKAIERGCREIIIAIGGSATNDGGIGAMGAMGARFFDEFGAELTPTAENLGKIKKISADNMPKSIENIKFTVMCDVDNPLTGERGATYVYGPQKGADEEKLLFLERGMKNYADRLKETFGFDPDTPGAGAAGGLGAALKAFLNAELKSGVETVLSLYKFEDELSDTDLVITGEGRVDGQSAMGKVLSGIGKKCMNKNVPCIAVAGCLGDGYERVYDCGIKNVVLTSDETMSLEYAMKNADALIYEAAKRILRSVRTGLDL